ncbi:hypothetical protein L1887_21704 [Cichorium endivia]|nr:hypothetical protein L1887_21704 [Cichorium endivia]
MLLLCDRIAVELHLSAALHLSAGQSGNESFTPYNGMEGSIDKIWITDIATDEIHLVGHTKGYVQVLVIGPESLLGGLQQL